VSLYPGELVLTRTTSKLRVVDVEEQFCKTIVTVFAAYPLNVEIVKTIVAKTILKLLKKVYKFDFILFNLQFSFYIIYRGYCFAIFKNIG